MKGFTPVRCSDHIFCIKCLEQIMKQPEPRCPQDHRRFAQFEMEAAQKQFQRQCGLFCGRFLGSSEALPLDCDCCYCEKCALYEVKKRAQAMVGIWQCFICNTPFPKPLLDKYTEILKQADFLNYTLKVTIKGLGNYKAAVCAICTSYIGKEQNVTLQCNHSFHKKCITDQAEAHTDAVVKGEIQCGQCKAPIDGNILQLLMKPQLFNKYVTKLIEAQNKMVYCPSCNTGYIADLLMLQQQAPLGCQTCGFQFCALCQSQWGNTHDIKRCGFEDRQKQILELGQAMTGPADVIAQCPTCKIPFLKDDHCEHIVCATAGCPDWNFCCSSLRQPCLAHSTHWHRPDCKHAGTEDISAEPMKQNCPECVKLGKRCEPPPQLKVPRRFDFDEY